MSNATFDYANRIWLNSEGLLNPNGCKYCGWDKKGHAWYSFCAGFEGSTGYYQAPDDALILQRMKANRAKKKT